jgi:hypothetical protein
VGSLVSATYSATTSSSQALTVWTLPSGRVVTVAPLAGTRPFLSFLVIKGRVSRADCGCNLLLLLLLLLFVSNGLGSSGVTPAAVRAVEARLPPRRAKGNRRSAVVVERVVVVVVLLLVLVKLVPHATRSGSRLVGVSSRRASRCGPTTPPWRLLANASLR